MGTYIDRTVPLHTSYQLASICPSAAFRPILSANNFRTRPPPYVLRAWGSRSPPISYKSGRVCRAAAAAGRGSTRREPMLSVQACASPYNRTHEMVPMRPHRALRPCQPANYRPIGRHPPPSRCPSYPRQSRGCESACAVSPAAPGSGAVSGEALTARDCAASAIHRPRFAARSLRFEIFCRVSEYCCDGTTPLFANPFCCFRLFFLGGSPNCGPHTSAALNGFLGARLGPIGACEAPRGFALV